MNLTQNICMHKNCQQNNPITELTTVLLTRQKNQVSGSTVLQAEVKTDLHSSVQH